ncbi:hypothetical protein MXB_1126 [Myxobolus squamalis]|nr:hypothetical protein MXB_1126 [Myxobolus squamalis]
MTVILKLTGFPVQTTSKEIITFLKKANVKHFEMFMCLEKSGRRKNMFDGTSYVIVKSEFDTSCIMRLRENRVGSNFIGIYRCNGLELRDKNLYPKPSEMLFQLTDNYDRENFQTHSIPREGIKRKRVTSTDDSNKLRQSNVILTDDFIGPDLHFSVRQNNFKKNIDYPTIKSKSEDYLTPIVMEKFNNIEPLIFYLVNLMMVRMQEKIVANSIREALKCIKLNSKKLGNARVSVVFPSNEEIDTVIFQNSRRSIEQSKHVQQAIFPTDSKTDSGNLAYSLLQAVTNIINQSGTKHSNEPTMVDNLENSVNVSIFDGIGNKCTNQTSPFTLVRIMNVQPDVSSSDLTYDGANRAIRKLNYQLLKYQPIELKII